MKISNEKKIRFLNSRIQILQTKSKVRNSDTILCPLQ